MPIITAMASNGETLLSLVGGFDAQAHYLDGMNLYQYLGSNPLRRTDPLGLEYDLPTLALTSGMSADLYCGLAASGGAGMGFVFVAEILAGNDVRNAAYDAAFLGVTFFATGGIASEMYFAMAASRFALSGAVATGASAATIRYAGPVLATLKFGEKAIQKMMERNIHRTVVEWVLGRGSRVPDPQGVTGCWMYSAQVWVNGKAYTMEVLWDEFTNTVYHVLYK